MTADEKHDIAQLEHEVETNPDPKAEVVGADYSGFRQKTDPKEKKLVRKLDMYIMVGHAQDTLTYRQVYGSCTFSTTSIVMLSLSPKSTPSPKTSI